MHLAGLRGRGICYARNIGFQGSPHYQPGTGLWHYHVVHFFQGSQQNDPRFLDRRCYYSIHHFPVPGGPETGIPIQIPLELLLGWAPRTRHIRIQKAIHTTFPALNSVIFLRFK